MKLLFKKETIGEIEIVEKEAFWISGNFKIYPNGLKYEDFFAALVCEDGFDEEEFDKELLDEDNWFVFDEDGTKGISMPAIYEDGDIQFRYR